MSLAGKVGQFNLSLQFHYLMLRFSFEAERQNFFEWSKGLKINPWAEQIGPMTVFMEQIGSIFAQGLNSEWKRLYRAKILTTFQNGPGGIWLKGGYADLSEFWARSRSSKVRSVIPSLLDTGWTRAKTVGNRTTSFFISFSSASIWSRT